MSSGISNSQDIRNTNYFTMMEDLVTFIKRNGLKVGDRLPSENILAEEILSNRSTLREILRILEAFGVITSKRGSGNIYTCDLEIGFMNLFMISNILLDGKDMDVNHLRAVIEADAVEDFIQQATDYDIFMLERIYREQMQTVQDKNTHQYLQYHIMFHDQIMKFGTNDIAKKLAHSGIRLIDNNRAERFNAQKDNPTAVAHVQKASGASHEHILNAIKEKDVGKAKALVMTHILIPGEIIDTL